MRKILTIKQASATTGLSEFELRQGAKNGRYPSYRAGGPNGKILFDLELLEQKITQLMLANTLQVVENEPGGIRPVSIGK